MTSMDPKILAAVFASIAALTVGTGGGSIDNINDIGELSNGDILNGISIPSSDILEKLSEKPEPENQVSVQVSLNSRETPLSIKKGSLNISDFRNISSEKRSLESDSPVNFKQFSGKTVLRKSNDTLIQGKSQGFSSSGVNLTQDFKLGFSTDSKNILITGIEKNSVSLEDVDVEVASENGASISQSETGLSINSFSGSFELLPAENRIVLNGSVDRLKAGGTVFTGN